MGGNVGLRETTRNTLRMLALLDRTDVPVAAGAAAPLVRPLEIADDVHGESGLDGADLPSRGPRCGPKARSPSCGDARGGAGARDPDPDRAAEQHRPVPPAAPALAPRIKHICLMGGAVREGNWTPAAEFNIWVDPEAARIVFRSGLPITMVGLDVTHQAIFRDTEVAQLDALGTPVSRVFADLLRFYARFHRERYGWDGSPIHDAVAVAHVAVPGLVTTEPYRVDVETTGEITRGRTVVDTRGVAGPPPNADVALGIDRERFVGLLVDAIAAFR